MYRIEWQDVKAGKYCLALVMTNVENFYAHKTFGLTTISVYGNLFLDSGIKVSLWQKVDSTVKWKIVTCIAKFWVVSGDLEFDGQAIMASISRKGDIRSTFKHMLTSNGYNNYKGNEYGGIYALQKVYARGMQGIMMVIERDGCCHLIPVYYGRLSILQSIDSIVPASEYYSDGQFNIVTSVSATHTRGEFMIGGFYWTKRITVKLE